MIAFKITAIGLIGLLMQVPLALAQNDMSELLEQIRQGSRVSATLNSEREQRFLEAKADRAALLQKAELAKSRAQNRADAAKAKFSSGQAEIAKLKKQLTESIGDSAEIYSSIAEVAGNFREQVAVSLISAQYPDRLQTLDRLAKGQEVPSIADIEALWFLFAQEAAESGKIVRFNAPLITVQGETVDAEIVRIGPFSAFTKEGYLILQPDPGTLALLPRQPGGAISSAKKFVDTQSEIETALIDPSQGNLLQLISQRPTLMDRIHQGGEVGYVIIAIGIFGAILALYQLVYLMGVSRRVKRQLRDVTQANKNNPLGRVLSCFSDNPGEQDPEVLETRLSEAVLRETPKLERFQSLLRMIVAAGPLLGLLGTVVGMIITFQVITEVGAGDPRLMAGGISRAMIATVLGLGIAIPLLFVNSFLMARSRVLTQILDEQAAGLLAKQLEAQGNLPS